uniref:Isochorismatase domain-containing protein 1 n=1 Tax=Plectus sambesii TaxID=2011161 RepID=A0A914UR53_9BILA
MSIARAVAAVSRLSPKSSALLICDMQEKFRNHICYFPEIVEVQSRLFEVAKILNVKVIATEQSTKALGHAVSELGLDRSNVPIIEKTKFSMCVKPLEEQLGPEIKSIILCGIEAHACVFQTAFDFLAKGLAVHVVADATSSRGMPDRMYAFKQMEKAGAIMTTSECVILGLIGDADHPKFGEIKKFVLTTAPDSGLLTGAEPPSNSSSSSSSDTSPSSSANTAAVS